MAGRVKGRSPNGSSRITQGKDGWWHTWVYAGRKADGRLDRRHIKRKTAGEVAEAAEELRDRLAHGNGAVQRAETVGQWLLYWLEHVVKPRRAYKTHAGYRSLITVHIIPAIGSKRLDGRRGRLEPEHVQAMYTRLSGAGLSDVYVLQAHRILRRALKVAMRYGRASRNVCDMIDPPTARRRRIKAHTLEEARQILAAAMRDRMAARWLIGMLLGQRQGEVLGLRWHRVHLDAKVPYLVVFKQIQRRTWEHGCGDPAGCVVEVGRRRGRPLCRTGPCPPRYGHGCPGGGCGRKLAHHCPDRRVVPGCSRHQRACPPPHKPGCTAHASLCPQRAGGGLVDVDVKSESGERDLALPPVIVEQLRQVREAQIQWAGARGWDWDPEGLVFAGVEGQPIDPRRDHEAWEKLLQVAGVADSRLHAARHDAATYMISSGVDLAVVQEVLGHAQISTTKGYVDVAREVKAQAVNAIAAALLDGQLAGLLQGLPARS